MLKRLAAVVCLSAVVAGCGGGGSSPTSPTPANSTRIITLSGSLAFGNVDVGGTKDATLTISNSGNATLNVSGMTGPSGYNVSWTNGAIPPGGSQAVNVRFAPTEGRTYNGTFTVNGDQTSGINTTSISGTGLAPLFSRSGVGNTVFDMPTNVSRVRIIGTFGGNCQNFIVHVGGRGVVNEILGTCSVASGGRYEGLHLVSGGVVEVLNSNGISWSMTEER